MTCETCYGLPVAVGIVLAALVSWFGFAITSHYVPPVVLSSIEIKPQEFSASKVKAGEATYTLSKSGPGWQRHCEVYAEQWFIDEHASIRIAGEYKLVETPKNFGPLNAKPRREPDTIPKLLAQSPGWWRLDLTNVGGVCWIWERLWPIVATKPVTAWFRITPDGGREP